MKKYISLLLLTCLVLGITVYNSIDKYKYVGQIAPHFYEIDFNDYKYDKEEVLLDYQGLKSCSIVRNDDLVGRNFDSYFNDNTIFLIRTAKTNDRFASIGIGYLNKGLDESFLKNKDNKNFIMLLPNITTDGINENGVFVGINAIPNNNDNYDGTDITKNPLNVNYVVRYLLDRATSADNAIELLKIRSLYGPVYENYTAHYFIADSDKTYIAEIINNELVVQEKYGTDQIMTNFNCNTEEIEGLSEGVERYRLLQEYYDEGADIKGMQRLLWRARFSLLYKPNSMPYRLSDDELYDYDELSDPELSINFANKCVEYYPLFLEDFNNDNREDNAWRFTAYNATYDLETKQVNVFVNEDYSQEYVYNLFKKD